MHYASNTIIMHRNVTKVATNYMAITPPRTKKSASSKIAKLSMKGSNTHSMITENIHKTGRLS